VSCARLASRRVRGFAQGIGQSHATYIYSGATRSRKRQAALALQPDRADAFNNRGAALIELGRFDAALADFDKAIALSPALTLAFFDRCIAHNGRAEFDAAIQRDPAFVDAKVGAASCVLLREFLSGVFSNVKDLAKMKEIMAPASQLLREARAAAPENPRLLWVVGPNEWSTPPANIGQAKAMETYERGLEAARAQKSDTRDPLEPSWGEPELLMSLAWSNLNRATPDLNAAENYAKAALQLVPYWHYVRDILMQQIRDAKNKAH